MADKKQNKVKQGGIRLDPAIDAKLHQLAQSSGQTVTWWIENILGIAFGLRTYPKQFKSIKDAKGLVDEHTPKTTRSQTRD